ncbi:MAG: phage integrase SAM-like domain-containing protein [Phycisphaeraceae bacterium]|nr:phage integrase SAM-like domain-containing protein [Phycisphaeraceae bacterium]
MASVTTRPNGSRFISFRSPSGAMRHITLGKMPRRYADALRVRIEDLLAAMLLHHAPSDETSRWLKALNDRIYDKLVAVELAPERQSTTIGMQIERYIEEGRDRLKPGSLQKLEQTGTKLRAFFGADTSLRKITPDQASAWRRWLKELGLSEAAIRTHCGNAKTIVGEAVRRKAVDADPFAELASGATASRYTRYITPDEIARVIDACPDDEWRLLFGLARYAGLRVSSESHLLTWADVDFNRGRLVVRSPKTERWEGHGERVVPITAPLMALLQARFDSCPEGEERLITMNGKGALIKPVRRIWARAGVEPWQRLWQTLRSSCEKEWAMSFPQFAVSKWIGHSIEVSGRHYANAVPDELYDKAAHSAQRQAQRDLQETSGSVRKLVESA